MQKYLIKYLKLKGIALDIILICETLLNNNNNTLCNIDGYELFEEHRQNNKGAGVAIYVKTKLTCNVM